MATTLRWQVTESGELVYTFKDLMVTATDTDARDALEGAGIFTERPTGWRPKPGEAVRLLRV